MTVPSALAWAWMGCVLLARRPGHPMGPLLCLIGLACAICDAAFAYERYTLVHSPGSLPFATAMLWVNAWAWAPGSSLTLVLLLVFPEGRLLSRRWRPALWAALALIPLVFAGEAFLPQHMGGYLRNLPNPYAAARAAAVLAAVLFLALACGLAAVAAAVATIVLRWQRADRVGRQQLKWFFAVLPVTVAAWIAEAFAVSPASMAVPAASCWGHWRGS